MEYIQKQIKEAMELIDSIDIIALNSRQLKQKKLNEAYSILFDLYNLLKMEVEDK